MNINIIEKTLFSILQYATMENNFIMPDENSLINLSSDMFGHFNLKVTSDTMNLNYKHKKLCFILLDGLGWNIYKKTGINFDNEIKGTSLFPSTTSNVLSSIFLNKYPGEHGINGYLVYVKELGAIINILGYTSSASYIRDSMEKAYPVNKIFNFDSKINQLNNAGIKTINIIPAFINNTSFSNLIYGSNNYTDAYSNLFHSFYALDNDLKKDYDFITYYLPYIDQTAHKLGPYNEYTVENARYILTELYKIIKKHDDYDFIITADHGHIEVDNIIDLSRDNKLDDLTLIPPYGDARSIFFNYSDELYDYLDNSYNNLLLIKKNDELYKKLFGKIDEKIIKKLPELIGISKNNDIYHYPLNQRKYEMKGGHSGLLKDEMEIPILKL